MKILGIDFIADSVEKVVNILKKGGLLLVPAAPALINIKNDPAYYKALKKADVVIPDSGFMVMAWNLFHKKKIRRLSGLEFLTCFLNDHEVRTAKDILLVDPNKEESELNLAYLNNNGFNLSSDCSYLAPFYRGKAVEDKVLLKLIEERKPKYIIINIGGGTQEKLGIYLRNNLSYKPAIICTGAAIAFLTGKQAKIPNWGDKFYLGWLFRCIQKPKLYVPRYLKAFKLALIMLQYRDEGEDNMQEPPAKIIIKHVEQQTA